MATSNGAVVQSPSSGSLNSNITNGQPASDFEVISRPTSSASMHNGHAATVDLLHVSPLMAASVTSALPSMTDSALNQAHQRIQELSKENQELRDFLRNNAEVMKKQFQTLTEYKMKVRNANAYHREKFEQTKVLVLNLRSEKSQLQEECDGLRSKLADLERSNKALSQHKTIGDSVLSDLQKEVDSLQQKLSTTERTDMILVSKQDVPADEENARLMEKMEYMSKENVALRDENSRLMKDVRQFKCTADQILADLENTQTLKSDRDKECKVLGKENTRMSKEIQKTLKEVCELREKNSTLATQVQELHKLVGSTSDGSYVNVQVSSLAGPSVTNLASEGVSVKKPLHTPSSQTAESSLPTSKVSDEDEECNSLTLNSNAMADMMSQIQTERDTVSILRGVLADKDKEIQRLEKELYSKDEVLLSRTTRIEGSVAEVTAEQAKVISDIQATTDKLCGTGATEVKSNDMMKSQVLTLINEVHESQTKLRAATDALDQKNKRVQELEAQMAALHSQLERQRAQDDSFIDSMRLNLANIEQALAAERAEHQNTRKQLAELRGSFNNLVKDYRDLLDTFDEYRLEKEREAAGMVNRQEEFSRLTAQVIGADEAIAYRDAQIKELKLELEKIPVLRAQADVYKSDFDAERKAREKQHEEKESILQEMNNLQTRNQQLLDELESFSRNQIVEMQQKHAPGKFWNRAEPTHTYTMVPPPSASQLVPESRYPYPGPQEGETPPAPRQFPQDDTFDYTQMDEIYGCHHCPKCGQQCPDLDSLQLHVIDCLDNDTPNQDGFRM